MSSAVVGSVPSAVDDEVSACEDVALGAASSSSSIGTACRHEQAHREGSDDDAVPPTSLTAQWVLHGGSPSAPAPTGSAGLLGPYLGLRYPNDRSTGLSIRKGKRVTTSRRDDVIAAATELFARSGFHAVGMRAIADAVGIRSSSLYHYFPSKIDLLHAIALDSTRLFSEMQLPGLADQSTAADRLTRLLRAHILYFHLHRMEEAVGLRELQALRESAPERHAEVQRFRRRYQDAIETVVAAGMAAGEFDCHDAHLSTLALLGMVTSVNIWFRETGAYTIEHVADEYADIAVSRILGARQVGTRS